MVLHKYNIPLDDPCIYPLGFMYISSVLKNAGHRVKVLNYNLWDYNLKEELAGQDVAMFTGFEEFLPLIKRDAEICRWCGVKTVVGGALATFKPQELVNYVDVVVMGEGEKTVLKAVVGRTAILATQRVNVDTLPLPDYEGFGIQEYHKRHGRKYMGVLTSRGCPHHCTFCAQTCKFQMREVEDVLAEVDHYVHKYGIDMVIFNDNTLNADINRYIELCKGMATRGIEWGAAIRADNMSEEMVWWSKKSGCVYMVVGVESFNQAKLNKMNKKLQVESTHRTLNLLKDYHIPYHGNVLVGFEDETYEDIVAEIESIPLDFTIFPCFVYPFIGTANGRNRNITEEQYKELDSVFQKRIEEGGKYIYPVEGMLR
jgi:radical SAM superfamily enzyme YgiQ (UPF0313 family)